MENMVNVYLFGKQYSVPDDLTIMRAMEYAGYQLVRGCGCRNGFCGACATIYRIKGEKELKTCSRGWLHHKGRNLHHFEYWIDYSINPGGKLVGMKMPKKYVAEMVIDRISASKNYLKEQYNDGSALAYYLNGRHMMLIDDEADYLARYLLTMLDMRGEEYLLHYMKHTLLRHKNRDYHVRDGRLYLD